MKTLKIENGDLVFDTQRNLAMIEGHDEEVQSVERLLTTNTGEWFLNIEHGLNYEDILTKPFDAERARLALVEAISQEPRVESVEDIEFEFDRINRHMVANIRVKMQSGNIVEGVIPFE